MSQYCKYFYSYKAGTDFSRQNLTSVRVNGDALNTNPRLTLN